MPADCPKNIKGIDGGIITPSPPDTATKAVEKSFLYPTFVSIGIVIAPTAAVVAGPEPDIAP